MSWFTAHSAVSIGLLFAAVLVFTFIIAVVAVRAFIAWKDRPVEQDEVQQFRIHERLAQLAQHTTHTSGPASAA